MNIYSGVQLQVLYQDSFWLSNNQGPVKETEGIGVAPIRLKHVHWISVYIYLIELVCSARIGKMLPKKGPDQYFPNTD